MGQQSRYYLTGLSAQGHKSPLKVSTGCIIIWRLDWEIIHFQAHSGCEKKSFAEGHRKVVELRVLAFCWLLALRQLQFFWTVHNAQRSPTVPCHVGTYIIRLTREVTSSRLLRCSLICYNTITSVTSYITFAIFCYIC